MPPPTVTAYNCLRGRAAKRQNLARAGNGEEGSAREWRQAVRPGEENWYTVTRKRGIQRCLFRDQMILDIQFLVWVDS